MAGIKTDSNKIALRELLDQIGNPTSFTADGYNLLNKLLESINSDLKLPFRLTANSPATRVLNVGSNALTNAESSKRVSSQPINASLPTFTSGTVTIPATSGSAITVSPGSSSPTLTLSSGNYIKMLVEITSVGDINVILGTQGASEAAATFPSPTSGNFQAGYVVIHNTGGSIDVITTPTIVQFSPGTGVAGSSGITALTGDVTASGSGSVAATLATVNSNVGSFGTATQVGTFTVNAKGLITAASNTTISITSSAVSDFNEAAQDAVGTILTDTASVDFTYNDAGNTISAVVLPAGVDHNSLANLTTGDVHTQYALLAGRSGGQSLTGGTASGNNLTLQSTSNATKGKILFGTSGYDEVNNRLGLTTASPTTTLVVGGPWVTSTGQLYINGSSSTFAGLVTAIQGTVYGYFYGQSSDSSLQIWHDRNGPMVFTTNATEKMRITGAGNVGIGATPGFDFHVKRTFDGVASCVMENASTGASAQAQFRVYNNAANFAQLGIYGSANGPYGAIAAGEAHVYSTTNMTIMAEVASGVIKFAAGNNTEKMRLDSNGRLGIGTTSPATLLHIATSTTAVGVSTYEQASADADSYDLAFRKARGTVASPTVITVVDELGTIRFNGYSGAGGYVTGAAIKAISEGTIATTRVPAALSFWTGTDAAPTVLTERMNINSAGSIKFNAYGAGIASFSSTGVITSTNTPTLGVAGTTLGTLSLAGNTSGTIVIQPQAAAGSYNFNLPTTAGSSGQVLTSAGGAGAAMTWSTPSVISAGTAALSATNTSKAVTFGTAFANTNYQVIATLVNTTDTNVQFIPITITAKSTTGFTASWADAIDNANYSLSYIATGNA